jgi:NAD(P)H-flavin reductase
VNVGEIPILSNRVGGLSGTSIRPLALRAVKRVRDAIGPAPLIIGMGGVSSVDDARQFLAAGANLVGVGSALTGMDSPQMREYFAGLERGLCGGVSIEGRHDFDPCAGLRAQPLPQVTMDYFPAQIVDREEYYPGLFKLVLDKLPVKGTPAELAGKFFFLTVPGVGEKPFAIFSAEEKSVVIKVVGRFTQYLSQLPMGSQILLRGPYGKPLPVIQNRRVALVGGGTGIASLYEIGKLFHGKNELHIFLGGRCAGDLFDIERFDRLGRVRLSTNDGSKGHRGFVTDLVAEWLLDTAAAAKPVFILCGPEPMVRACFKILTPAADPDDIWAAIEYVTSCGVGICGKCASPSGALTCIDGPFMRLPGFVRGKAVSAG